MATRHLYIARHGEADAFGNLTEIGREQSRLLGRRLAHLPIDAIWHSPLPRAADSARQLNIFLAGNTSVEAAGELIDHVPHVPKPGETPPSWLPFFDGYDRDEVESGHRIAENLLARFATPPAGQTDTDEVLITHARRLVQSAGTWSASCSAMLRGSLPSSRVSVGSDCEKWPLRVA